MPAFQAGFHFSKDSNQMHKHQNISKFFIFLVKTLKSKANSNFCDVRTIILWFKLFLSTAETKA